MNPAIAIAGAGGAFAATVIAALVAGIWIDGREHTHYWTLLLFFGGIGLGAYTAWRLIARAVWR